ncbi:MAG: hypothetical protein Q4D14_07005 [Bacteroidales bacterium]|nr:hypothetical protein [Bacteroidales bacterium]
MKKNFVYLLLLCSVVLVGCNNKQKQVTEEENGYQARFIRVRVDPSCSNDACFLQYDVFNGMVQSCKECTNIIEKTATTSALMSTSLHC